MLKKVEIKNFQALTNVEIDFHENFNIIAGESDSGKSSLVRALNWVLENRPQGHSFLSWSAKKDDSTVVRIEFDDNAIIREKSKKTNQYIINDHTSFPEELKALKSEVPPEVRALTRMDKYNLQEQEDIYFMLRDSPGERARRLNEISGLDIIDSSIKKVNSIIVESKKESEWYDKKLTTTQDELKELEFLDKAGADIAEAEALIIRLEECVERQRLLEELIEAIQDSTEAISEIDKWLKVEDEFLSLQEAVGELQDIIDYEERLAEIIAGIKHSEERIAEIDRWLRIQRLYKTINETISELEELNRKESVLSEIINTQKGLLNRIAEADSLIKMNKDKYNKLAAKIDRCPTCGQKVNKKTLEEHILGHKQ